MPINIDGSKGIRQNTTEVTKIPVGTTAQRPANPQAGMTRFNTDTGQIEGYDGFSWGLIGRIPEGERALHTGDGVGVDADVWNFTEMPVVGGNPIVESDSNSDGEFTRWADGTQICGAIVDALTPANDSIGEGFRSEIDEFDFPQVFVSSPRATASTTFTNSWANPTSVGSEIIRIRTWRFTSNSNTSRLRYIAFGRWF